MGALGGPQGVDPVRLSQFRLNVGQRGQMLGAFSYVMQRDPNFNPAVP